VRDAGQCGTRLACSAYEAAGEIPQKNFPAKPKGRNGYPVPALCVICCGFSNVFPGECYFFFVQQEATAAQQLWPAQFTGRLTKMGPLPRPWLEIISSFDLLHAFDWTGREGEMLPPGMLGPAKTEAVKPKVAMRRASVVFMVVVWLVAFGWLIRRGASCASPFHQRLRSRAKNPAAFFDWREKHLSSSFTLQF